MFVLLYMYLHKACVDTQVIIYDWRTWFSSPVLTDLPLPTHFPTPMEQQTLGKMGLKGDSAKWLNNVDPALCNKISQALMTVDSSFL